MARGSLPPHLNGGPFAEAAQCVRQDLLVNARNVFTELGSQVTPIGSVADSETDVFSDVDVWIAVPDDALHAVLERRQQLYHSVGSMLFAWERPRYAPVNGMHSIALYDDPRSPVPAEVDFFIASQTMSQQYASFIDRTQPLTRDHEWATGKDDGSRESLLSYCALIALWSAKYFARGSDELLGWAAERHNKTREAIPELPDISKDGTFVLSSITRSLISCADGSLRVACQKVDGAVELAKKIRGSAVADE
jgi:hypothetical protein